VPAQASVQVQALGRVSAQVREPAAAGAPVLALAAQAWA
jgi:hypothetical protein